MWVSARSNAWNQESGSCNGIVICDQGEKLLFRPRSPITNHQSPILLRPISGLAGHHRSAFEHRENGLRVGGHGVEDPVLRPGVFFADRQLELCEQRVEIASDVGKDDRLAVDSELL